jgi:hypothetical protein
MRTRKYHKRFHMHAPTKHGMPSPTPTDAARREEMIREAAYFRSQHRQPCLGKELEDWLVAKEQIDRMLTGHA